MPLPSRIGAADQEKGNSAFTPPPQKDHAIPRAVRCSRCKRVGFAFFEGGFNVKIADKAMNGRPFRGDCGYCAATGIELIPIPELTESDSKELRHLYNIQETLKEVAKSGIPIPKNALILPQKKLEELRKRLEGTP